MNLNDFLERILENLTDREGIENIQKVVSENIKKCGNDIEDVR